MKLPTTLARLSASTLLFGVTALQAHDDNYINFHYFNTTPNNAVPVLTAVNAVPLNSIERFDDFNSQLECESHYPGYYGIATDDTALDSDKYEWKDSTGNKHAYSCIHRHDSDTLQWLSSTQFKIETSGRKLSYMVSTVTQTILDTVIDEAAPDGTEETLDDGSTLMALSNPNEFSDGDDDTNETASLGDQLSFTFMTDLSFSIPWAEKNGDVRAHNVTCENIIFAHQLQNQSDVKWLTAAYTQGETLGSDFAVIEATDGTDIIMDTDAAYTIGKDIYKLGKGIFKALKNRSNHVWWMGQYFNKDQEANNFNFNSYYGSDSYSVAAQNLSTDQFQNAFYCKNTDGDPNYDFLMITTGHENADDDFEVEFVRLLNNGDQNITQPLMTYEGDAVHCPDAPVGTKEALNGRIYTAVDNDSIRNNYDWNTNPDAYNYLCTTHVTDMSYLFQNAKNFNESIITWDTSNVTTMAHMFDGASAFRGDVYFWDTGKVTDMNSMFLNATAFDNAIGKWDTGNVTDMSNMFNGASSFKGTIYYWDTSKVTDMSGMFKGAGLFNSPMGGWDVGNVTTMDEMFSNAASFNQDLSKWCITNITVKPAGFDDGSALTSTFEPQWGTCPNLDADFTFDGKTVRCPNAIVGEKGTLNGHLYTAVDLLWLDFYDPDTYGDQYPYLCTTFVESLEEAFDGTKTFNQPIGTWDTSNVVTMEYAFGSATAFNQPIGDWNTSNVTNMHSMFGYATAFNQDISGWCVKQIPEKPDGFDTNSSLSEENEPIWGTCPQ